MLTVRSFTSRGTNSVLWWQRVQAVGCLNGEARPRREAAPAQPLNAVHIASRSRASHSPHAVHAFGGQPRIGDLRSRRRRVRAWAPAQTPELGVTRARARAGLGSALAWADPPAHRLHKTFPAIPPPSRAAPLEPPGKTARLKLQVPWRRLSEEIRRVQVLRRVETEGRARQSACGRCQGRYKEGEHRGPPPRAAAGQRPAAAAGLPALRRSAHFSRIRGCRFLRSNLTLDSSLAAGGAPGTRPHTGPASPSFSRRAGCSEHSKDAEAREWPSGRAERRRRLQQSGLQARGLLLGNEDRPFFARFAAAGRYRCPRAHAGAPGVHSRQAGPGGPPNRESIARRRGGWQGRCGGGAARRSARRQRRPAAAPPRGRRAGQPLHQGCGDLLSRTWGAAHVSCRNFAGGGAHRGDHHLRRPGPPAHEVLPLPAEEAQHQPLPRGPLALPRPLAHLLAHRARVSMGTGGCRSGGSVGRCHGSDSSGRGARV